MLQQVKTEALAINDGLECFACGSYRRGKDTCGDVDIIVTHPDGRSHQGIMAVLLARLKDKGNTKQNTQSNSLFPSPMHLRHCHPPNWHCRGKW